MIVGTGVREINGLHSMEFVRARDGLEEVSANRLRPSFLVGLRFSHRCPAVLQEDEPKAEAAKSEADLLVEAWVGEGYRGRPEFGQALSLLQGKPGGLASGAITVDDLIEVYGVLIAEGKFWYVEHDVTKLGVWPRQAGGAAPAEPFEATFDYIFYSDSRLELRAVRETLTAEQRERIYGKGERLPCAWHMSDHLPVAACFEFCGKA